MDGLDTVLNVRYWTIANQELNIHNEYQIMAEGLETSMPSKEIEKVWFNSLIGYDENFNSVPDKGLSPKLRYGTLHKPRQGWFINHQEAFKQVIEKINSVLLTHLIVDELDLSPLTKSDPLPSTYTRLYDKTVDVVGDLDFVGVSQVKQASLMPIIKNGKVTSVSILDPGKAYKTIPTYEIIGDNGKGAVIE